MTTRRTIGHTPDAPRRVSEAKRLLDAGVRLSDSPAKAPSRSYFCRTCGREQTGDAIPKGWYTLTRHSGNATEKALRLGVYCSIDCLSDQLPRLAGIADHLGDRWGTVTEPYRQKATIESSGRHRRPAKR